MELNGEASPPLLPVTEGAASWTTSQGDDNDGGIGTLDDDADMQDSDPDTTDNYDPELGDGQDLDVIEAILVHDIFLYYAFKMTFHIQLCNWIRIRAQSTHSSDLLIF